MTAKGNAGLAIVLAVALGQALAAGAARAQNFVEGQHYWLEPVASPGAPPGERLRGADRAKGAVIWNDGYDPERNPSEAVPPIVRYFADAGWDAFNLARHTVLSTDRISPLILLAIDRVKAKGYRRIVLIGHSAGAFAGIQAGSYRPDITGILSLAPAGFGDYGRGRDWRQNDFMLRKMWDSYEGSPLRVAAGFFNGDDWYETKEPHLRGPYAKRRLSELGVANFIIDQPDYPGMSTHFGGVGPEFARRFAPCLEHFLDTGERPACEDGDPRTAALFGIAPPPAPAADDAGFAGRWQGTIATGRFVVLTIPPSDGSRKVAATYQTGRGVDGEGPETTRWSLLSRDGMLVREGKFEFRLRLTEASVLKITYADYASAGAEQDFALLQRVAAR